MSCSHPPPLTPDQLSDALDGNAESEVYDHLAKCDGCTARLERAREAERRLNQQLYRWDCPTPQQLGDYHLGLARQAEAAAIVEHLRQCPHCTQELDDLRLFLAAEARPPAQLQPSPVRRAPLQFGELIGRLLPRAPALAMRGETGGPITAEADGVMIVLDVQPAAEGRVMIVGQVAAEDQDRWTGALVTLRQSGVVQATAIIDDLGGFRCETLLPGPAEIRITPQTGRAIVLPDIEIAV